MHPGEGVITEARLGRFGGERSLPLAGPGTPEVAEFCIAEFALASACPPTPAAATSATRSSSTTASPASDARVQ